MTAYTASFSNGTTKTLKNSTRTYTHAWKYEGLTSTGQPVGEVGFCASKVQAEKALRAASMWLVSKPTRGRFVNSPWNPGTLTFTEVVEITTA